MKPTHPRDYPLAAFIEDGLLVISIGVNALAHAFHQHPDNHTWNPETSEYEQLFTVSDPLRFAEDTLLEMEREDEAGTTRLSRFLDSVMLIALENGSTGILDEELEGDGTPRKYADPFVDEAWEVARKVAAIDGQLLSTNAVEAFAALACMAQEHTARRCAEIVEAAYPEGRKSWRVASAACREAAHDIRQEFGLSTPKSEYSTTGTPHQNPSSGNLDSCPTDLD